MTRTLLTVVLCAIVAACSPTSSGEAPSEQPLTRGQKDSLIAQMPIPGAKGVGKALNAVEATQKRAKEHDDIP